MVKANISTTEQVDKREKLNVNGMEFVDIKCELYRTYYFPVKDGWFTIKNPEWLFVRPSKSHEVIDAEGITYYTPNNFIALCWKNRDGEVRANF